MKIIVILLILLPLVCFATPSKEYLFNYSIAQAIKADFDGYLVASIATIESNWTPPAFNPDGSIGLFQVQCGTARGMKFRGTCKQLFDYKINTKYGIQYLKTQVEKYGFEQGIASYQSGRPYICQSTKQKRIYKCKTGELINRKYVDDVLRVYNRLVTEKSYEYPEWHWSNFTPL